MIILVGASGSGKSSIEKMLVEQYGMKNTISYTTRKKRENEIDGVDYHFVSRDFFELMMAEDFFAETGVYNGEFYGTAKKDCTKDKVAVITPSGLRQLKEADRDGSLGIISFYIKVPRRDRLIKLLERNDDIDTAYRRSLIDEGLFDGVEDEVDFVLENKNYKHSVEAMCNGIDALRFNKEEIH